jgi:rubrerythrin
MSTCDHIEIIEDGNTWICSDCGHTATYPRLRDGAESTIDRLLRRAEEAEALIAEALAVYGREETVGLPEVADDMASILCGRTVTTKTATK